MDETDSTLREALQLMETALALVDSVDSALDFGAHLDLAICRLRDALDTGPAHDQRNRSN